MRIRGAAHEREMGERRARPTGTPDLGTQLEDLFTAVWEAEENWRFDDRLELALRARHDG